MELHDLIALRPSPPRRMGERIPRFAQEYDGRLKQK